MIPVIVLAAMAASAPLLIETAEAQTPLAAKAGQTAPRAIGQQPSAPVPTTPPGKAPPPAAIPPSTKPAAAPQGPQQAQIPMSAASYTQALEHSEGLYTEMQRAGAGGQIQEAWDKVESDPETSQHRQGVYVTRLCDDCVYKVRTREMMTTTLRLPDDAVISGEPDLGDPVGFTVKVKTANVIAVRPTSYGVDSNLTVYTRSGRVYPFYLRAESYNSIHVPDMVVKIAGREQPETIKVPETTDEPARPGKEPARASRPGDKTAAAIHDLTSPGPASGDFIRSVPFDPAKLRGWRDYKLWGDDSMTKPVVIYRDDFFTYIQYGEKFDPLSLPTAYVTIDGIDERVNTRVQGSTFIVESVEPLITLKNGKRYLCIQYTGEQS